VGKGAAVGERVSQFGVGEVQLKRQGKRLGNSEAVKCCRTWLERSGVMNVGFAELIL